MPRLHSPDVLFQDAEQLASDFSLFPRLSNPSVPHNLQGLVSERRVRERLQELRRLAVDEYVRESVAPAEDLDRSGIRTALKHLGWRVHREATFGPLYTAEVVLEIGSERRRVGLLAQDRSRHNGAWMPEHHLQAVQVVRRLALQLTPIVTFIDTPGAVADAEANSANQAHAISRLIAEMAQLHVPTVGIIYGNGYSGGAIPLATTNILLSVVDGVFNTIQPRGLANIARKYNLSWQECAKAVGVSAYELYEQGYLDGIVDYSPLWGDRAIENLERAICSSIGAIEDLARHFAGTNDAVFEHYQRTVRRYLDAPDGGRVPSLDRALSTIDNPTQQPNIYGVSYRYLRYLGLRRRVSSTTAEAYGRLATDEIPSGDLGERIATENRQAFQRWVDSPLKIRYDASLSQAWRRFRDRRAALGLDRGTVAAFLFGSRESNFEDARSRLLLEVGFHLYNLWKGGAANNLALLVDYLNQQPDSPAPEDDEGDLDVMGILLDPDLRQDLENECRQLIVFDVVYDRLIAELKSVAFEAMETNRISRESIGALLDAALARALPAAPRGLVGTEGAPDETPAVSFDHWIRRLVALRRRGELMQLVAQWKKAAFPTVSEPLFGLITFFFDHLLPSYYDAEHGGRFDGRIRPRNIGIKDFWNRLDRAYKDLLIQEVLIETKRRETITPARILDAFFTEPEELDRTMMTADPVAFPGFRISIEQALEREVMPCGTVTALAGFEHDGRRQRVGIMVSNLAFQAGSFDMASGVKFCRLLLRCADERLPVICFVSSGGMQTKEGAGSLFSMAIVNDRITRFVRENELPVLVFGFGDCTGGAQASLVTHPLVETFYFSGTSMPFAGQIVVPSHLPTTSTLSNYLSEVPGAMMGLVRHPFADDLDGRLLAIDAEIPIPNANVAAVIRNVLEGRAHPETAERSPPRRARKIFRPVSKVLLHARGCTAVKLIDGAHDHGLDVVLVQSDPDMESVAAARVSDSDALVCLGGSTPDESYLNAHSVIRIAESEGCDAIHPGIGFLSESSAFAALCAQHGLNFIGPDEPSMERVGNKSNAVQTTRRLGIPVVPGSHGVVTSPGAAFGIAEEIGYPVVLKAVHGGGGRGIEIVREPEQLEDTFLRMGAEARGAFGSSDLYLEKFIERFRHVEIQVLRDRHGHTRVLGLRDCSVQRNQQKVIEESGSTLLSDDLRTATFEHARHLADDVGYVGAGTVEFIFDLEAQQVYFMEVNARLQVEHPVTEAVTGIDIVREQFRIAAGESIEELEVDETGYAIELRINAERLRVDAEAGLRIAPDPGTVRACVFPDRDDVGVIAAVEAESVVSPFYDNLLAQVVARGGSRAEVIKTLCAWLSEVRIEGIGSNIPLLRLILEDEEFVEGRHDTGYVARFLERQDVDRIDHLLAEVEALRGPRTTLDRSTVAIEGSDELKVIALAPCVFYGSPGPGRAEFVAVGDRIRVDTTLCLVEAMKLFEELSLERYNAADDVYPSDADYEVVRVNAHDGQLVSEGDLLFVVRPTTGGHGADSSLGSSPA